MGAVFCSEVPIGVDLAGSALPMIRCYVADASSCSDSVTESSKDGKACTLAIVQLRDGWTFARNRRSSYASATEGRTIAIDIPWV